MSDSNPVNEHIHTPDDGRGVRTVYVNGKKINYCVYADTMKGIVRHYDDPPKIDESRKRIITRTIRGKVEVIPGGR